MLQSFVIIYIKDILIYSRNLAEHHQHVAQVLQRLRDYPLYLKLEKWESSQPSLTDVASRWTRGRSMLSGTGCNPLPSKSFLYENTYSIGNSSPTSAWLPLPSLYYCENGPSLCLGIQLPLKHLTNGKKPFAPLPSSNTPIQTYPSKWNWMPILSLAEQNIDIGNRELLTIKLAQDGGSKTPVPSHHGSS